MKPLRLAVDTNVLLDLADEVDDVLDAVAIIAQRLPDTDKLVLPSVLDELAFLSESGPHRGNSSFRRESHAAASLRTSP